MRFLCLLLAVFLALPAHAQELDSRIDAALRRYSTLGASVAVFQNGEILYTHTYGVCRIGGENVTPDTAFQVGSISKMISNIALLQLMEANDLSLETELGDVLGYPVRHPDFPSTPVTLRQLMTHTASLRDGGDYQDALSGKGRPLRELFQNRGAYTFFSAWEPGTRREYSNFGGGIIGSLVEKLSGQTVDAYMQEHVFAPLGIAAAYQPSLLPEGLPVASIYQMPGRRIARDLQREKGKILDVDAEAHYFLTAGKLIISAPDLARLLIALCDGGVYQNERLLKESTVREMLRPQDYRGSVCCETGNGLFLNIVENDVVEGRTLYGHGGKAYGMLCAAYFDPTDRTGVVMLTNGCQNTSTHNGVGMLSRMVITLCYNELIGSDPEVEDPFAVK